MNNAKYRCLVVDDEPIARKIVETYIQQLPQLFCVGVCKNASEAIEKISQEAIDIVFLDINMPNINGISMLKIVSKQPLVIFTTAYKEFALEGYEFNTVDYLVKPFLFERFAKAVAKALERLQKPIISYVLPAPAPQESVIFIKSEGELFPVSTHDILYCEAMKNYTKIVLKNGKTYCPLTPISKFETALIALNPHFLRVHRSFLIAQKAVQAIGAGYVLVEEKKIPLGDQYRSSFFSRMGMPE
jgi:DNA-binding LytR/AlgR family response regulator